MALLFDQNQGSFRDTGSQRSPVKKNTGIMRKEMSKLDEVAPRGHTLAYITPEEARVLNKGGGGIDQDGSQMMGPNGIPMYAGYDHRQRKTSFATKPISSRPSGRNYSSGTSEEGDKAIDKKNIAPKTNFNNNSGTSEEGDKAIDKRGIAPKTNFNTDNFMETVGNSIGKNKETINNGLLTDPGLLKALENKEKGDGILERKGDVSNKIIDHLKTNAPQTEKEQIELLYVVDKFPNIIKNKIKKSVDDGTISLMVDKNNRLTSDVKTLEPLLTNYPTKLKSRPEGMPSMITYSTTVGDRVINNTYAKLYNDTKNTFIAEYSTLFNTKSYDSKFNTLLVANDIANQIGLSTWEKIGIGINTMTGGLSGDATSLDTAGSVKEGTMNKVIYEVLADKFNSDFSWKKHQQVKVDRSVFPVDGWVKMQIEEKGFAELGERGKGPVYVEKDGKLIPVVRSYKDYSKAMYVDDTGQIIEYDPPEGSLMERGDIVIGDMRTEQFVNTSESKIPFLNTALSGVGQMGKTPEQNFLNSYGNRLNEVNVRTERPYLAVQPEIKKIMTDNPEKYGNIDDAWSSKGGYADASKNYIGGFEYGYFGSDYADEYINLAMIYQARDFKTGVENNSEVKKEDSLPDALDNIAGIRLGQEWAKKGLPFPTIEQLAELSLEYADVVKRPLLNNNSLMTP